MYSGATKFSSESSDKLDDTVLAAYVFLHVNLQFEFLVPSIDEIVGEYKRVYGALPPVEEEYEYEDDEYGEADSSAADMSAAAIDPARAAGIMVVVRS